MDSCSEKNMKNNPKLNIRHVGNVFSAKLLFNGYQQIDQKWDFHSDKRSENWIGTIVGQQWRHENLHRLDPFGTFRYLKYRPRILFLDYI